MLRCIIAQPFTGWLLHLCMRQHAPSRDVPHSHPATHTPHVHRFQVLRMVRELPYPTADVAVLPDAEEVEAVQGLGLASALQVSEWLHGTLHRACSYPVLLLCMHVECMFAHKTCASVL